MDNKNKTIKPISVCIKLHPHNVGFITVSKGLRWLYEKHFVPLLKALRR